VEIKGAYTFDAPQDEVWAAIQDPEVLSKTLPGVQELKQTGDNEYWARMKIRIGPVQGVFSGTVKLSDMDPPSGLHISVDGKGAPGFVNGEGDLKLIPDGQTTIMEYKGDAQVGGRLASVGQRLIESSTQAIIDLSLKSLDKLIEARIQGEEIGEMPALEAPSELAFAAGVTRKMIDDMVPVEKRQEYLQSGFFVIAAVTALWIVSNWWINRIADRVALKIKESS
jgi:hypothetical protein